MTRGAIAPGPTHPAKPNAHQRCTVTAMKQTLLPTHVRRSASETIGNALNRTG
jgi:hypothetical protein